MRGRYIEIVTEEDGVTKRTLWTVACDELTGAMGIAHTAQKLDDHDRRPGMRVVSMNSMGTPGPESLVGLAPGEARVARVS